MNFFSGRTRALAVAAATSLLALTAAPAQAVIARNDAAGDVGTFGTGVTTQEKQRMDMTRATLTTTTTAIKVRFALVDYRHTCVTGVPCTNVETRFEVVMKNGSGSRSVYPQASRYQGGTTNSAMSTRVEYADGSYKLGLRCNDGQIKLTASATDDYAVLAIPRSCFPRDWRFATAEVRTGYYHGYNTSAYRGVWDNAPTMAIDMVPHR